MLKHSTFQSDFNLYQIQSEYDKKNPQQILQLALSKFDNIAISFSGAEDVVLIDMVSKITKNFKVFSIDTGRLHSETYQLIEEVRKQYDIELEIIFPNAKQVEAMVREKGMFSFYEDGHKECCGIRKVSSLRRKLSSLDAWVTGQRKDQSPITRADVPIIQIDTAFSTEEHQIIKFNPLANWTSDKVWEYIRSYNVPYNKLHEKGFISIGCEPCTQPTLPNQHEREGRWWWENPQDKECGFHNLKS
jgi:phosphoadenosine phosphosulfate reductase